MKAPVKQELAWAAGFVDGEGCFHCLPNGNRHRVIFGASQVDRRALDRLRKALGLGTVRGPYGPYSNPNASPIYEFEISTAKEVEQAFTLLKPWLGIVKRVQARRAIAKYKFFAKKPYKPNRRNKRIK